MKSLKLITYLLLSLGLFACDETPSNRFVLEGTFTGSNSKDSTTVFFGYYEQIDGVWMKRLDSIAVHDGKFRFDGRVDGLSRAWIEYENAYIPAIYIEPGKMRIEIDRDKPYAYKLTGTTVEWEHVELKQKLEVYDQKWHEMSILFFDLVEEYGHTENMAVMDSLRGEIDRLIAYRDTTHKERSKIVFDFASKNSDYKITPGLLEELAKGGGVYDMESLEKIYNSMPESNRQSLMGQLTYRFICQTETAVVGSKAPDFIRETIDGQKVSLSDYKDKYVLLDFWASWCGPCLRAMPKMEDIYGKYHTQGLEIIGVSCDEDADEWRDAVEKYGLGLWKHVLSIENCNYNVVFPDDLSLLFNIGDGIPFYVLIDKFGEIAYKWQQIDDEALMQLEKIFK